MTEKRAKAIFDEAVRRAELLFDKCDTEQVLCTKMRFDLKLGLLGYPFKKPQWMKGKNYNKFVTQQECESKAYDNIISYLFSHYSKQYIHATH